MSQIKVRPNQWFKEEIDPQDIRILEKWVSSLESESPKTVPELDLFLKKVDELNNKIKDALAEIYIKMTCDTSDEIIARQFNAFQQNVVAYYALKSDVFKKIILNSVAFADWVNEHGKMGELFQRLLENNCVLFRQENIPLGVKESELSVQYRAISGGILVDFDGEKKTMSEMAIYLKNSDRNIREAAWKARTNKLLEHKDALNTLFDELQAIRDQMAKNAGFDNYRDYMHQAKARFSYTVDDVLMFQDAIEKEIVPLIHQLNAERKEKLAVETLRPWDLSVSLDGKVLKPVNNPEDLVPKQIAMLSKLDSEFSDNFSSMRDTDLLDLFNRPNKAPGGYSYPLFKYGASFIFMNAVGLHSDLTTLVHEVGHAMHEFAKTDHDYTSFLDMPMESCELASMTMELLTMEYWSEYYADSKDMQKACFDQLESALRFFPWCAMVDGLQQKIYTEARNADLREKSFLSFMSRFSDAVGVDWSGLEKEKAVQWMFQLHIFEVPFYYVEYGIAQLGALSMYREYKKNPKKALQNYKAFLGSGYQISLRELYQKAGIELNFSREYIKDIVEFVRKELQAFSS